MISPRGHRRKRIEWKNIYNKQRADVDLVVKVAYLDVFKTIHGIQLASLYINRSASEIIVALEERAVLRSAQFGKLLKLE